MNKIIRPIGSSDLGFDERGQLIALLHKADGQYEYHVKDLRGKTCLICSQGWDTTPESFLNEFVVPAIDGSVHKTCFTGYLSIKEADMFYRALCDTLTEARIFWNMNQIPNEYGGGWNTPWYKVQLKQYIPYIKIGRRKSVYHLSLHDLTKQQVDMFEELFKTVESTKGKERFFIYVHAWTEIEFVEHLERFKKIIQADKPFETNELTIDAQWKRNL